MQVVLHLVVLFEGIVFLHSFTVTSSTLDGAVALCVFIYSWSIFSKFSYSDFLDF